MMLRQEWHEIVYAHSSTTLTSRMMLPRPRPKLPSAFTNA